MESGGSSKTYLRLFIYLAIFTIVILSTTVVLHEMGHFIAGISEGCKGEIILLDSETLSTYTKLSCPGPTDKSLLYFSPFILVVPFALAFLALKEFPEKYFSIMVLGIGILAAGKDFLEATGSEWLSIGGVLAGIILYVIAEFYIADKMFSRFEEQLTEGG